MLPSWPLITKALLRTIKMPIPPEKRCIACKGVGRSSKGQECVPCKGKGRKIPSDKVVEKPFKSKLSRKAAELESWLSGLSRLDQRNFSTLVQLPTALEVATQMPEGQYKRMFILALAMKIAVNMKGNTKEQPSKKKKIATKKKVEKKKVATKKKVEKKKPKKLQLGRTIGDRPFKKKKRRA